MRVFKPHQAIDIIAEYLPENPIIVEAGAFNGTDSIKMAKQWPQGTIHAFEPVPEIYAQLKENTRDYKNIKTYPLALSDKNGIATFYVAEKKDRPGRPSQAGSLLAPAQDFTETKMIFSRTIKVKTITLDAWAQENSIAHVDLLWLDMQGKELDVLKASTKMINTIKVIFCEINFAKRYQNQFSYQDLMNWAQSHQFRVEAQDFDEKSKFGNIVLIND